MKKVIFLVALISSPAFAGGSSSLGTISKLYFMKNGALLFSHSGNRANPATDQACVMAQRTDWAIDGSTDLGKTQISGLLTAYSLGKEIVVHGVGDCLEAVHKTRETVDYFYMN